MLHPAYYCVWLPLIALVGVGATFLYKTPGKSILLATHPLPAFHILTAADIKLQRVASVPEGCLQKPEQALGHITLAAMAKDQPLLSDQALIWKSHNKIMAHPVIVHLSAKRAFWLGAVPSPGTLIQISGLPSTPFQQHRGSIIPPRILGHGYLLCDGIKGEQDLALAVPKQSWLSIYAWNRTGQLVLTSN